MALLIVFFLLSICFSFLCSILEAVLLSITPSFIQKQESAGVGYIQKLKNYKAEIDKPLSAILSLNTIAHTVGAIGVGAQAGAVFGSSFIDLKIFHISAESIIATVMTLAILLLSEIIPKTLGANNWKSLTPFTVRSLQIIIITMKPLVFISQGITKALKKNKSESVLSRSDFKAIAEMGKKTGFLNTAESKIIGNLLRLESIRAKDVMTPRSMVIAGDASESIEGFYNNKKPFRFSRIPIYNGDLDNLEGMILKDQMLENLVDNNGKEPLSSIKRPILSVEEKTPLPDLFEKLLSKKNHVAMVVDQFGTVTGLVSLEDVLETILGLEIVDEMDNIEDLQAKARDEWKKRAIKLGLIEE